jgi:hypothetical protein
MSINYEINQDGKTIFLTARGEIELEEIMDIGKKILVDPDFEKGYNRYVDFSNVVPGPNVSWEKVKGLLDFIGATQILRGKCRWAIFAPGEDAHIFSTIFARLTEGLDIEVKVFISESEAKEWLGI